MSRHTPRVGKVYGGMDVDLPYKAAICAGPNVEVIVAACQHQKTIVVEGGLVDTLRQSLQVRVATVSFRFLHRHLHNRGHLNVHKLVLAHVDQDVVGLVVANVDFVNLRQHADALEHHRNLLGGKLIKVNGEDHLGKRVAVKVNVHHHQQATDLVAAKKKLIVC